MVAVSSSSGGARRGASASPSRAAFQRADRLRRGAEFRRVFREGRRLDGPLFLLVAARSGLGRPRLGVAAGRKLGGAVRRNRVKRWLRESFRRSKRELGGWDLVVVAKPVVPDSSWSEVDREFRQRLGRLARQAGRDLQRSARSD